MSCSSSLVSTSDGLVLDTSVLINLHASKYGKRVLDAIPNDIWIPQMVAEELEHQTSRKNGELDFLKMLLEDEVASIVRLDSVEYEIFRELTSTTPSLDDGEAATIAVAVARKYLPVVDERRGRGRAISLISQEAPAWSLDLLRHPAVITALGSKLAIEVLYFALRFGRMRIPPESTGDVIALLGVERSRECTCLPGYRERFAT